MSKFVTYAEIYDGKISSDFGVSVVKGSSLTIPGQGCDLMQIIESVVKLPPLDERTFDVLSKEEPDVRALQVKLDLEELYTPDGVALAKDVQERRKAKETAKEVKDGEGATPEEGATPTD